MSRIAGYAGADPAGGRARVVDEMLERARSNQSWKTRASGAGEARFGVCGWRKPELLDEDGLLIVLDGVFYAAEDSSRGTGSDAQRLAALYRRHGFSGALQAINGDFAVALHDARSGETWLGRDRFGLRPLYTVEAREHLAFASRPRALLGLPGVSREPDPAFVGRFAGCHYRAIDDDPDASPYRDIRQLPAASYLHFSKAGVRRDRYWRFEDAPDLEQDENELAERYRELLLDAVRIRLDRAERPAFTLSGGMDSSSVLASAVNVSGVKQTAFSSVYDDETYDESDEIRSMLDANVEEWVPVRIGDPDIFDLVGRMVREHDEPVATGTWLSHYLLCADVSQRGFGGLFGGMGGDELNAGEYEYFFPFFADLRAAGNEELLSRETDAWVRHHDHPIFRKSQAVRDEVLARVIDPTRPGRCLGDRSRMDRYAAAVNRSFFDVRSFENALEAPFTSYLKNRCFQDITRETAPCCLRAGDRNAAAFGLDTFLPFFDHRLVELMFRVPGTLKIRDGVTKVLLRLATRGLLPEETRTRIAKTGWNAPGHVWFSGKGAESLRDLVGSRRFRERGIYDVAVVGNLIDEHERIVASGAAAENHMMFFWQLLNLELWLRSVEDPD